MATPNITRFDTEEDMNHSSVFIKPSKDMIYDESSEKLIIQQLEDQLQEVSEF